MLPTKDDRPGGCSPSRVATPFSGRPPHNTRRLRRQKSVASATHAAVLEASRRQPPGRDHPPHRTLRPSRTPRELTVWSPGSELPRPSVMQRRRDAGALARCAVIAETDVCYRPARVAGNRPSPPSRHRQPAPRRGAAVCAHRQEGAHVRLRKLRKPAPCKGRLELPIDRNRRGGSSR